MMQFYFLSVILNILSGVVLSSDRLGNRMAKAGILREFLTQHGNLKLGLAILTFLIGIFKLLSVTRGDVIIVGDLLPALAGLIMGSILALEYYQERSSSETADLGKFSGFLLNTRQTFGLAGIIIAVLHFLFPGVLFL